MKKIIKEAIISFLGSFITYIIYCNTNYYKFSIAFIGGGITMFINFLIEQTK
jgi:hypothetical protein